MTSAWPQNMWGGLSKQKLLVSWWYWAPEREASWKLDFRHQFHSWCCPCEKADQTSWWIPYRSNMHFPAQFHRDANLRKTTELCSRGVITQRRCDNSELFIFCQNWSYSRARFQTAAGPLWRSVLDFTAQRARRQWRGPKHENSAQLSCRECWDIHVSAYT